MYTNKEWYIAFNAYSLLLFCGSIDLDTAGRGLIVDGWLRLRGWARIGVLVSRLRMMLDEIIAMRIDQPNGGEDGERAKNMEILPLVDSSSPRSSTRGRWVVRKEAMSWGQ